MSLEAATVGELGKPNIDHVRIHWGCERDKHCQDVLASTYGTCVFTDVMHMATKAERLYCSTHNRMCKCGVPAERGRSLASNAHAIGLD